MTQRDRAISVLSAVLLLLLAAATLALGQTFPAHSLPTHSLPTYAVPETVEAGDEPPEPTPTTPRGGLRHGRWMSRRW